jgi:hypothetical protein
MKAVSGANARKTTIEPSKTPSAKTPEAAPVSPKTASESAKTAAVEPATVESTATAAAKA